jgi:hypothetical protein
MLLLQKCSTSRVTPYANRSSRRVRGIRFSASTRPHHPDPSISYPLRVLCSHAAPEAIVSGDPRRTKSTGNSSNEIRGASPLDEHKIRVADRITDHRNIANTGCTRLTRLSTVISKIASALVLDTIVDGYRCTQGT